MSGQSPDGFDLNDADWFLHDIDPGSGRARFVRTDRAALSAEPFLDHRWRAPDAPGVALPLAGLQATGSRSPRLNFIWHTSFCASTLLAACLDQPGRSLSLKEPRVLVILAALKRSGQLGRPGLAEAVFSLLGRRFDADEQILIKPSNGANNLIAEAAALTEGRMLLMYSDCESFVLSMARQGRAGFAYVRELFRSLAADGHPIARSPAAELIRLTDLEVAALVWRLQMDALETASARLGARARSLDYQVFLDDPDLVLPQIDDFMGLGIGPGRLDQVVAGPLFRRDAKRPGQVFDARNRADERTHLRAQLGADLGAVLKWVDEAFPHPPALAPPLISNVASYSRSAALGVSAARA
jgi:hypothetical protein